MKKRNSTTKNAMWIIACKIVQAFIAFIINMLSAKYLGPSNFGVLNYAISVAAFVLPIVELGFKSTLVREIIEHPDKEGETMGTALFFSFLSSLVCIMGICSFVAVANPNEPVTFIVCALYSITLSAQALELIQYWFQAKLISQYTSLTSLFAYIVVAGYKVYLLATEKSVYWFSVTYAMDYLIIAAILLFFYHRIGSQKLSVSFRRFREMFATSRYFIVSSLMVTIFAQTDKIMLKFLVNDEAVGIYSVAVNCAGMTSFVFAAIIDSIRPSVFENKKRDQKAYENSLIMGYSIIIWLSFAQSIFMSVFSKLIIDIMYGSQYTQSANVLRLIVWYTTFSYMGPVRNIWMIAENKQNYLWIINLSGAIANIVLNAIMIPFIGVMGAALASLITQIFTNVIIGFIMKPIKENNVLLVKALNPRVLIGAVKALVKR